MEFAVQETDNQTVFQFSGRLTFSDHSVFHKLIQEHFKSSRTYVFDLQGLEFLDSSGIGMILIANDRAQECGGKLAVKGISGQVESVFKVAKLNDIVSVIS